MSIFSVHADEFYFHSQVVIVDNDADNRLRPKMLSNESGELFIGWREMNDIGGNRLANNVSLFTGSRIHLVQSCAS